MMSYPFENLVLEGGGVKGISYLGMLEVLDEEGILENIKRVAGASAGAITSCIVSFGLPANEIINIANTLEYSKVPHTKEIHGLNLIPKHIRDEMEKIFGDIDCLYRLIHKYGWYSSSYFYEWMKSQIALQFDETKKQPPYTFKDFKDASIHKENRPFLDLYIVGTDMTSQCTRVFSAETTPDMEVAEAVRASMSIPIYFESISLKNNGEEKPHVFSDGGTMRNYPINIFDTEKFNEDIDKIGTNMKTLGGRFKEEDTHKEINNLMDYIESLFQTLLKVQDDLYKNNINNHERTINIDTLGISTTDFDIKPYDRKYNLLVEQGKKATKEYIDNYKTI